MDSNWASENIQTIRTLMERSALYRRALAPVMLSAGIIGLAAAAVAHFVPVSSNRSFALYWLGVSLVTSLTAFLLVRRQALRDHEPVWSSPARRVTEAMQPSFIAGGAVAVMLVFWDQNLGVASWHAAAAWVLLYGCALCAAGFFTPRGLKLFGRVFIYAGCGLLLISPIPIGDTRQNAHYVMGFFFGGLHLAYGIYLYFTERRNRT
jgi:hypothetical protein